MHLVLLAQLVNLQGSGQVGTQAVYLGTDYDPSHQCIETHCRDIRIQYGQVKVTDGMDGHSH